MSRLFAKWKFPKQAVKVSADFQLFLYAANAMNRVGHVHHDSVKDAVEATGLATQTLYTTISKLVAAGALSPESSPQRLVVNAGWLHHDVAKRHSRQCPDGCHGMWFDNGQWFHPRDLEVGTVAAAEWARSILSQI
ncbi:hypothetical protein [Streptomyces sp. NBC_00158]|uniref:hypothetical protein n=1 Tax=Streptomyces sp. NBC_00158 TaxID=2903627 RepID=UPI00324DA7F0